MSGWLFEATCKHHPEKGTKLADCQSNGGKPHCIIQLLKQVKDTIKITSLEQIWSGSKTGVQNVPKKLKFLVSNKYRLFNRYHLSKAKHLLFLSFVSAASNVVPPLIIHKGEWVQDSWRLNSPAECQLAQLVKIT